MYIESSWNFYRMFMDFQRYLISPFYSWFCFTYSIYSIALCVSQETLTSEDMSRGGYAPQSLDTKGSSHIKSLNLHNLHQTMTLIENCQFQHGKRAMWTADSQQRAIWLDHVRSCRQTLGHGSAARNFIAELWPDFIFQGRSRPYYDSPRYKNSCEIVRGFYKKWLCIF